MKTSTSIDNKMDKNKSKLSENIIWLLMFIISIIHGIICISPGILSSCITEIKKEFKLSDKKFGSLGTIYGFGSLIGSLIFTLVIEITNHKYLICGMIIINILCCFVVFFKINYSIFLLSRLLILCKLQFRLQILLGI